MSQASTLQRGSRKSNSLTSHLISKHWAWLFSNSLLCFHSKKSPEHFTLAGSSLLCAVLRNVSHIRNLLMSLMLEEARQSCKYCTSIQVFWAMQGTHTHTPKHCPCSQEGSYSGKLQKNPHQSLLFYKAETCVMWTAREQTLLDPLSLTKDSQTQPHKPHKAQ